MEYLKKNRIAIIGGAGFGLCITGYACVTRGKSTAAGLAFLGLGVAVVVWAGILKMREMSNG